MMIMMVNVASLPPLLWRIMTILVHDEKSWISIVIMVHICTHTLGVPTCVCVCVRVRAHTNIHVCRYILSHITVY